MHNGLSRRSLLSLGAGAAAASALAACGGGGGDAGGDISKDAVKLRFTWWGSDARHKRTQQAIDMFTKKYPNITVSGEFKEWNGYWDSLATTVAANDAPDIIQMDELYLASYAERGALLDLGTAAKHLKTDGIDPAALDTGKVDGKQYAVPTGVAAYSIIANTTLLDQYKIPVPDDSTWTWDDLKRIGLEVSKASGGKVTGVQSWGFDAGGVNIWARQAGATLYDASGKVSIPPAVLAGYWQYLLDLAKQGIAPAPSVTVERAGASLDQSGTATNTSAFGTWWNTQLTSLTAASGQQLKLLKLPTNGQAAAAESPYYKPSMFWSVSSRSKHPAEAALFADFLLNTTEAGEVLLTDRGVPSNSTVRSAITPKLADTDKAAAEYLAALKVGAAPRVTPNGASGIEAILKRHTEEVLFERLAPQAAAESFIKELQTEIDAA
ncbi:sugar ABC transporter substrate-binding protein [Actinoplanes lobatus]|uniref:Multiple sugar transport system substrate-binding protein n=1 Tax=Actinoplanes lobatus TaxID=113568 RepID=A0A7W7HIP8_9ACTN|nr:extracellular solute-binding protein [Actinoplanes lobatus]MBB4751266.1 multiple sugar transport system substrate-binding protein [Actinoplanes lobatus]GGN63198.1 sugar ABC transporter substrate-binding protein [Actinoplanes lobatus]GIE44792.1 sugar ABC transporter substrate-binding protein [Actinoplanes lobatus]